MTKRICNDYINYIYEAKNKRPDKLNTFISVFLELFRSDTISGLIKIFYFNFKKLKIKDSEKFLVNGKLLEMVHRWCWDQYYNTTSTEWVIPHVDDKKYDYTMYLENINYISCGTKISYEHIKVLDENIISYLDKKMAKFIDIIHNKKFYLNVNVSKHDNNYILSLFNNIYDFKHISAKINITISSEVYNRLNKKLEKFSPNLDKVTKNNYIFCLIYRYQYLDSRNQQLAIHSNIKSIFNNVCVNFELFGSGINVVSDYYCSIFYDIEKLFGSQGNFFDIKLYQGIYWCNPPYINNIMEDAFLKLTKFLTKNLVFIITIPIWDEYTKKKNITKILVDENKNVSSNNFKDYMAYHIIHPYIKKELLIPKKLMPYINYRENKIVYAAGTYMLLLYSDIDKKIEELLFSNFNNIVDFLNK